MKKGSKASPGDSEDTVARDEEHVSVRCRDFRRPEEQARRAWTSSASPPSGAAWPREENAAGSPGGASGCEVGRGRQGSRLLPASSPAKNEGRRSWGTNLGREVEAADEGGEGSGWLGLVAGADFS